MSTCRANSPHPRVGLRTVQSLRSLPLTPPSLAPCLSVSPLLDSERWEREPSPLTANGWVSTVRNQGGCLCHHRQLVYVSQINIHGPKSVTDGGGWLTQRFASASRSIRRETALTTYVRFAARSCLNQQTSRRSRLGGKHYYGRHAGPLLRTSFSDRPLTPPVLRFPLSLVQGLQSLGRLWLALYGGRIPAFHAWYASLGCCRDAKRRPPAQRECGWSANSPSSRCGMGESGHAKAHLSRTVSGGVA